MTNDEVKGRSSMGKGVSDIQSSYVSGFNQSWLAENDIGIFTSLLFGYRSLAVQVLWLHNSQTMISPVGSNDLTRKISQGGRVCFVSIHLSALYCHLTKRSHIPDIYLVTCLYPYFATKNWTPHPDNSPQR